MLADAARENECIEPAERGGERSNAFLRLIAEDFDRLRGAQESVDRAVNSARISELSSEMPSRPPSRLTASSRSLMEKLRERRRYRITPGSRSPERVLIAIPPAGVIPMLVSIEMPSRRATRLAPLPKVGDDGAPQQLAPSS